MKKGNLLIVDDEVIILKRLEFNLEDFADHIYTATNGYEALDALKEEEIHCIICDINMPKMNGVDVIKQIRADGNDVPFIFYTAHGNQDLMREAIKYGAFDFLNKPSLDGLEEVTQRGLQAGVGAEQNEDELEQSYVSEYQALLKQVKGNKD